MNLKSIQRCTSNLGHFGAEAALVQLRVLVGLVDELDDADHERYDQAAEEQHEHSPDVLQAQLVVLALKRAL